MMDQLIQAKISFPHIPIFITYTRGTTLGVSAARNTAAKIANGQWLAFIDSDDEWLPHKLEKQFEFIHDNS
jgi:glycosyltransferase involved in cell wall biosynthesis